MKSILSILSAISVSLVAFAIPINTHVSREAGLYNPVSYTIKPPLPAITNAVYTPITLKEEPKPVTQPVQVSSYSPPTNTSVDNCGDNFYANYIYSHESSCKLVNPNGSGCDGIGQACPAAKIYDACPNMDYACQNSWFTAYAQRYGGWEGAYNFWLEHSWW